ncbi:MAG: portal protein, partial [Candidatus Nanopelagicaceae bacterium]
MSQLFGFQINRKEGQKGQSPVPPSADEPVAVAAGGYYGTYVETDNASQARNEFELIRRYRDMALHPEVDSAIDEVVNEFVVSDANDTPVAINLDNLDVGAGVKNRIRNEFEYIKRLLNFDNRAHEIVRNWYIDGRVFYHKVIDLDNPKKGILELRYIDPMKIKKVRQKLDNKPKDSVSRAALKGTALEYEYGTFIDYYLYNPRGFYQGGVLGPIGDMSLSQGVKIAVDSITFIPSGLQDLNKRMTLSFLHKAIKSLNQLRMIEDSLVIYRLSRAPE